MSIRKQLKATDLRQTQAIEPARAPVRSRPQWPQVPQLPELQPPQEPPPPATGVDTPPSPREKEAKADSLRSARAWQTGQAAPASAWLKGRSISNFSWQDGQTYSYIGIFFSIYILGALAAASQAGGYYLHLVASEYSPPYPLSNRYNLVSYFQYV